MKRPRIALAAAVGLAAASCVLAAPKAPGRIVFLGDSLTAGDGVEMSEAYPALIQKKIDALGWNFRVVNAGLSGDTTAAARRRLAWSLKTKTDVLVIALGANDGLRGIPPDATRANLQWIIEAARKSQPGMTIILAGMKMPPNYGSDYTRRFAGIFPDLARRNRLPFVPFLLEGVGGQSEMNVSDRVHPNARGHALIAATVWKALHPELAKRL